MGVGWWGGWWDRVMGGDRWMMVIYILKGQSQDSVALETAECGLDRLKVNISFGSKHLWRIYTIPGSKLLKRKGIPVRYLPFKYQRKSQNMPTIRRQISQNVVRGNTAKVARQKSAKVSANSVESLSNGLSQNWENIEGHTCPVGKSRIETHIHILCYIKISMVHVQRKLWTMVPKVTG